MIFSKYTLDADVQALMASIYGGCRTGGATGNGWPAKTFLSNGGSCAYITNAGSPAMAINVLQNKQSGPGGGTRRLHHFSLPPCAKPAKIRFQAESMGAK
ncbi:hypothetical protein OBA45_00670 [bacterium]|nr:hypothetical protein [bacterium]